MLCLEPTFTHSLNVQLKQIPPSPHNDWVEGQCFLLQLRDGSGRKKKPTPPMHVSNEREEPTCSYT